VNYLVSSLSIGFMFVSLVLSVGLPIGLVVYFYLKEKISIKAVFIGALMFFLFQGILRVPIMTIISYMPWYQTFALNNMVLVVAIMAFTAGLFETVARYIGLKFILRKELQRKNGFAYGIGHGGIEAILLVGISYGANILFSFLINSGAQVDSLIASQLINTPSILFLAAGIERVFAILFHIAAALLVTYGIISKKKIYILYSFVLHFLLDGVIGVLQIMGVSVLGIEIWIAFIGILSLVFIIKSKNMFSLLELTSISDGGDQDE